MDKKAVFFDIDGTIVNERNEISESTRYAIRKLCDRGHLGFICTGRAYSAIEEEILKLGFQGVVSGAGTFASYLGKIIYNHEVAQKDLEATIKTMDEMQIDYILEGKDYLFAKREMIQTPKPHYQVFVQRFQSFTREIDRLEEIHANKFTCCFTPEESDKMQDFIRKYQRQYDAIVHESVETQDLNNPFRNKIVEFVPKGYNKAEGIKRVIEKLGIPWENTCAFGDSNNDIEMLEYVNYSVVMKNGSPQAKKVSKYMTDTVDDQGIYQGLQKLKLID